MNKELENYLKIVEPVDDIDFLLGKVLEYSEYEELDDDLKKAIPDWVVLMLTSYPIAGLIIRFKTLAGEVIPIQFSGFAELSDNFHIEPPGIHLGKLGYICVADDPSEVEHPFFININEGDNPPVYQIKASTLEDPQLILQLHKIKVANSFSEVFGNQEIVD